MYFRRKVAQELALKEPLGVLVVEGLDHDPIITQDAMVDKFRLRGNEVLPTAESLSERFFHCAPNGLRFTRAALIKRDVFLADSNAQNRPDLVDAQRRRVQARVGRLGLLQPSVSSAHGYTSSKVSLKRSGLHQQLHTQVQLECVGARSR